MLQWPCLDVSIILRPLLGESLAVIYAAFQTLIKFVPLIQEVPLHKDDYMHPTVGNIRVSI